MNIYIFGLGAIGSNILSQLARKYPDFHYYGIDCDKVEERNISTQSYFLTHVGLPKSHAILPAIGTKVSKFKYKPFFQKIDSKIDIEELIKNTSKNEPALLLDCFDNTESRKLFEDIPGDILHIGFSPQYAAEILWQENYSSPDNLKPEEDDICVMAEAVPFITFVTSMATFVISNYIDTTIKDNYIITNKMVITKL